MLWAPYKSLTFIENSNTCYILLRHSGQVRNLPVKQAICDGPKLHKDWSTWDIQLFTVSSTTVGEGNGTLTSVLSLRITDGGARASPGSDMTGATLLTSHFVHL